MFHMLMRPLFLLLLLCYIGYHDALGYWSLPLAFGVGLSFAFCFKD